MKRAWFRFYAELNDFLAPEWRARTFEHSFWVGAAVKDLIESFGVPHTEVDLVLVNGESADFGRLIEDGDRVSVYPVFESIDITPLERLRPTPLRDTRFVADAHLGRLAAYLRMLGFDTAYRSDWADAELARISPEERRVLLTRDRALLMRSQVTHGYAVRATQPLEQAAEVTQRFDLAGRLRPFTRCLRCNGVLEQAGGLARCPGCARIYWKGSHYRRMLGLVELICRKHDTV